MNPVLVAVAAVVLAGSLSVVTWTMAQDGWWVPVLCWSTAVVVTGAVAVLAFAVTG